MAVPCTITMALFVGSHFVAADHRTRTRAEVLDLALRRLERRASRGRSGAVEGGGHRMRRSSSPAPLGEGAH